MINLCAWAPSISWTMCSQEEKTELKYKRKSKRGERADKRGGGGWIVGSATSKRRHISWLQSSHSLSVTYTNKQRKIAVIQKDLCLSGLCLGEWRWIHQKQKLDNGRGRNEKSDLKLPSFMVDQKCQLIRGDMEIIWEEGTVIGPCDLEQQSRIWGR